MGVVLAPKKTISRPVADVCEEQRAWVLRRPCVTVGAWTPSSLHSHPVSVGGAQGGPRERSGDPKRPRPRAAPRRRAQRVASSRPLSHFPCLPILSVNHSFWSRGPHAAAPGAPSVPRGAAPPVRLLPGAVRCAAPAARAAAAASGRLGLGECGAARRWGGTASRIRARRGGGRSEEGAGRGGGNSAGSGLCLAAPGCRRPAELPPVASRPAPSRSFIVLHLHRSVGPGPWGEGDAELSPGRASGAAPPRAAGAGAPGGGRLRAARPLRQRWLLSDFLHPPFHSSPAVSGCAGVRNPDPALL